MMDKILSLDLGIFLDKIGSNIIYFLYFLIILFIGMAGLAVIALVAPKDFRYYVYKLQQYPLINAVVKFGVAFPLSYHFFGGLRHLVSIIG